MRYMEAESCADRDREIRIPRRFRPAVLVEFSGRYGGKICIEWTNTPFMYFTPETHGFTLIRDTPLVRHMINHLLPYGHLTHLDGVTYYTEGKGQLWPVRAGQAMDFETIDSGAM